MSVWAENAPGALFRSPIVLTVQWISKSAGSEDGCGPSRPDATQGCGRPFRPTARYLKSLRSPKMVSKILFCHTASDLSGGDRRDAHRFVDFGCGHDSCRIGS